MSTLNEYIKKIEKYIEENSDISENLLIRYVYLDLAKRFSFNSDFQPFGTSKKRKQIYNRSNTIEEMNKCMENNLVICNSVSNILEYILKHFGVNIKTVVSVNDFRDCPHVYNVIYPKNGEEAYSVDLQEDMYRVQMHGFTANYGVSIKDFKTLVISRTRQEQMDKELGYINENNHYSDEYLYLLKSDIGYFEKFEEKAKFILENIDVFANPKMKYTDKQWYHVRILQNFFDKKEFDYNNNKGRIHFIDCYKDIGNKRIFLNCVTVQSSSGMDIYVYNNAEGKYNQVDLLRFAKAVNNGLKLQNGNIQGLGKAIKKIKEMENEGI